MTDAVAARERAFASTVEQLAGDADELARARALPAWLERYKSGRPMWRRVRSRLDSLQRRNGEFYFLDQVIEGLRHEADPRELPSSAAFPSNANLWPVPRQGRDGPAVLIPGAGR
jgi:hypothetical protein